MARERHATEPGRLSERRDAESPTSYSKREVSISQRTANESHGSR
jgi:hypothetical protein